MADGAGLYSRRVSDPRSAPPSEAPTIQPSPGADWSAHVSTMPGPEQETSPEVLQSALTTGHPSGPGGWFQPGSVVAGTFRVEQELGRGAMGVVVLATHLALDRQVALKVHRASHPQDVARLAREAKAMAKVRHPNVVGIYDVRQASGRLFIAMEYVEGFSGRRWLVQSNPSWRQRLDVCLQAAAGLQAAHEAGLVHRDFKPENILVGSDGRVLVADFGLARAPGAVPIDPATPNPGVDAQLTAAGEVTGTPAYMSPEQWRGGAVDARSDVFALCVVVYEALYGRRPFVGSTARELLTAITGGIVLDPPADTEVPGDVFDALKRGMSVEPAQRFASVALLVRALRTATSSASRLGIGLAVGLAVLVGGGAIAWWGVSARDDASGVELIESSGPEPAPDPPLEIEVRLPGRRREPSAQPDAKAFVVPTEAEVEEAQRSVQELSERYAAGTATMDELMAVTAQMQDVLRRARDHRYVPAQWDGSSTFVCGLGDRLELRGVKAQLDTTAIRMEMGCGLRLVDVEIDAPIAISGRMADRLIIDGATFDVSDTGIEIGLAQVEVRGLEIRGEPQVGVSLDMHAHGTFEDSHIVGRTALRVGMHGQVRVRGGRVAGATAVDAQGWSRVELDGVEIEGRVRESAKASVVHSEADR